MVRRRYRFRFDLGLQLGRRQRRRLAYHGCFERGPVHRFEQRSGRAWRRDLQHQRADGPAIHAGGQCRRRRRRRVVPGGQRHRRVVQHAGGPQHRGRRRDGCPGRDVRSGQPQQRDRDHRRRQRVGPRGPADLRRLAGQPADCALGLGRLQRRQHAHAPLDRRGQHRVERRQQCPGFEPLGAVRWSTTSAARGSPGFWPARSTWAPPKATRRAWSISG
jgi:hypothetical protein